MCIFNAIFSQFFSLYICLQVVQYLAGCGLQSCVMLVNKGYPDIGWNPVEGERYLDFLRFAVFCNGETVSVSPPRPSANRMLPSSCPISSGQVKVWKRTPTSWWGCSFAGRNVLAPPCGVKVGMACCQPWRRPLGFHRICPEMVPLLPLREARHCKTSQPAESLHVQIH